MNLSAEHTFLIIFLFFSYLFCAIPYGKIISQKVAGIDITQRGSRNIGATNVAREIGFKWGLITLAFDAVKGFVPVMLFRRFFPGLEIEAWLVGVTSLLGHQFSIYQGFRGGKGVATALGIYLALSPVNGLIAVLFFVTIVYVSDFVSLGSMLSAALMPLLLLLSGKSAVIVVISMLLAALICVKHNDNIRRLKKGEERRFRNTRIRSEAREGDPTPHRNKNE